MKFEEVLPALRTGKKIRRNNWCKDGYIYINSDGEFENQSGKHPAIILSRLDDLEADDWEIVKELKKVKLRDISSEKLVKNISKWLCARFNCEDCPLLFVRKNKYVSCNDWANCKDLYSDKFLDQEVEVEEDD